MSSPTGKNKPAILTEAGLHTDWVARPLLDAGHELKRCTLAEVPDLLDTGRYNVLVIARYYTLRKTMQQEEEIVARLVESLRRFLEAGGGLYFTLPIGGVTHFDGVLGPYGAKIIAIGIEQPDQVAIHDKGVERVRYGYTTDVRSPVAEGVDGVWYPVQRGHAMATRPVRGSAEDGWQTVLAGSKASHTTPGRVGGGNSLIDGDQDPGFTESVPIMAVRDALGDVKGRLAVCGIPSGFHIDSPNVQPLAKRFLTEGFEGRPSGLLKLFVNTVGWLAEPSMQAGALGGGQTDEDILLPAVPRYPDDVPVKWADREFPPDDPAPKLGLIGARTSYTTGSGTVADYVAKAKAAGLDFIVFLEDFAELDEEKLDALKADCEAHTTDTFFAVPGYTTVDVIGTRNFQYGYRIRMIGPDLLSDDGKVLSPGAPGGRHRTHRMDAMHCYVTFGDLDARVRRGTYLHGETPKYRYEHRFNDSIALVTWENGKVVEDARELFLPLQDMGHRLNPTVLTFMNSPDEVDAAVASGWRNGITEPYGSLPDRVLRKHMAPELEWWGMIDEDLIASPRYRFNSWQSGTPFQYVTSGPQLLAFTASASGRDAEWRYADVEIPPTADWFRNDVVGYRLRMKVASDVGLDEVRLYDGERLIRQWRCNGAKLFERELDLTHHQQMQLMLEARDTDGGILITSDYATMRLDWCDFYCADRNNPLAIGFQKDDRGLAFGWGGTIFLTYNNSAWGGQSRMVGRYWYPGDSINPVPMDPVHDEITPTDGGVSNAGAGMHLMPQLPALDPPERGLMVQPIQEMVSTDVAIGGFIVDTGYDPDWPGFFGLEISGWGCYPTEPTRYVQLRRRAIVFRPKPYALTTVVFQHDLGFKEDPKLTEPLRVGWLDNADHVFYHLDGSRVEIAGSDTTEFTMPWRKGETLVSWLDGRRPAIFINDGADVLLVRDTTSEPGKIGPTETQHGLLTLRLPVESLPKGDNTVTLRFIGIGGTYNETDPDVVDKMRGSMGLDGEPAYTLQVEAGNVISQQLFLDLDGQGAGAAFTIPKVDLPMALPITVRNLNENWPTFLVDLDARRWRPLGMLEGVAYATLDTAAGDSHVFLGHPVTASDPRVHLSLTRISESDWVLEVHNPTDEPLEVAVTPSPFAVVLDWGGKTFSLQAGQSRTVALT